MYNNNNSLSNLIEGSIVSAYSIYNQENETTHGAILLYVESGSTKRTDYNHFRILQYIKPIEEDTVISTHTTNTWNADEARAIYDTIVADIQEEFAQD